MSASDKKAENPLDTPYPLALYKHIRYGYVSPWNYFGEADRDHHENYVRISEPVNVLFTALKSDEVIRNAVAACNLAERAAYDELNRKLADILEQKQQLLALTYQPEETVVSQPNFDARMRAAGAQSADPKTGA